MGPSDNQNFVKKYKMNYTVNVTTKKKPSQTDIIGSKELKIQSAMRSYSQIDLDGNKKRKVLIYTLRKTHLKNAARLRL